MYLLQEAPATPLVQSAPATYEEKEMDEKDELEELRAENARLRLRLSEESGKREAAEAAFAEADKWLGEIYRYADNALKTASRDIGDWVDAVEHIGLLAANED